MCWHIGVGGRAFRSQCYALPFKQLYWCHVWQMLNAIDFTRICNVRNMRCCSFPGDWPAQFHIRKAVCQKCEFEKPHPQPNAPRINKPNVVDNSSPLESCHLHMLNCLLPNQYLLDGISLTIHCSQLSLWLVHCIFLWIQEKTSCRISILSLNICTSSCFPSKNWHRNRNRGKRPCCWELFKVNGL